ncbi:LysR family transcriptional regulator [Salmonella enterica subsp. enterica serovar Hadar]|uniref:LysR family transcriptional regulator n=1 Tax=Salmonella hadar TaxID=149385 RepID=A0A5Y2PCG6_SALHA|nr:LysR family transcriptional regulator [Salmonella enterica subsp. enterica serovar Hadar]ECF2869796.1 LysR family transcriptional regulator [Salmonella enterica subsp. enterica serovar Hadar]EDU9832568.1 LysR family transcriptional regulator [Salmonella enterica subsp. enterica serovar Hadar]EDW5548989.1 LysR family transcriptional regulator [Salmonella enterica subsp. enterica serovar Hadar]EJJ5783912.1 LysR family transcriptional regulator [Salmonella enterica]
MKPLLDVLIILDALEKEGSFAAASAKLFKTPSALSYTVHKLENDLNIQLLDRSGHRARFTRTGKMLLEKGREVLHTVRELEKQAIKLHEGWENELVFAVAPHHPLVHEEEPLSRQTIKRFRAIVVGDSVHSSRSIGSELLDAQEAITVFDFKTKLELQISGLGCGYLPRYLAQRFLESGALIEKKVVAQIVYEPVWVGWNEQTAGLASGWWRDEILANNAIAGVYTKSPV